MTLRSNLVASAFLFTAACASTVEIGAPDTSRESQLYELQLLQDVFRTQYKGKHVFNFENHGQVTVRQITLEGFPGHTYLRCRFHFQNRTAKPVVQSWVSLDVVDAEGALASTQSCHMVMPTSAPIARGSYYSDELRTPTYGAHLKPGWTWRVRCESDLEQAEEPLNPPVPEWQPREHAPMLIKDRSWPYPIYYYPTNFWY